MYFFLYIYIYIHYIWYLVQMTRFKDLELAEEGHKAIRGISTDDCFFKW